MNESEKIKQAKRGSEPVVWRDRGGRLCPSHLRGLQPPARRRTAQLGSGLGEEPAREGWGPWRRQPCSTGGSGRAPAVGGGASTRFGGSESRSSGRRRHCSCRREGVLLLFIAPLWSNTYSNNIIHTNIFFTCNTQYVRCYVGVSIIIK